MTNSQQPAALCVCSKNTMILKRPESVGQWVRTQRLKMEMTQTQLAEKAGVTQRLISQFETGKVGIQLETLWRIFNALQLRLAAVDLKVSVKADSEVKW